MAGANVRRWGPVSPEPLPTRDGQASTLGCSPYEQPVDKVLHVLLGLKSRMTARIRRSGIQCPATLRLAHCRDVTCSFVKIRRICLAPFARRLT